MEARTHHVGGARVGWCWSSFPLAALTATEGELLLNVVGQPPFAFAPEQVTAIRFYRGFPFIAWGVRICHCVDTYPKDLIFGHFLPWRVIQRIREVGFRPAGKPDDSEPRRNVPRAWSV